MPRSRKSSALARLGAAILDAVRGALGALLPQPEPQRIPVRAKDRR